MSRYRKIEVKMWGDERFRELSPLPPSGQSLWLFLLTGPHTGPIPGLFRAGRAAMAEELGWEQEAFDKAFKEVFDQGMVKADWKAKLVWVPKAIKYNKPENGNVVAGWAKEFEILPECALKYEALNALKASVYVLEASYQRAFEKAFEKALEKASAKALGIQEQEQEQETGAGQSTRTADAPPQGDPPGNPAEDDPEKTDSPEAGLPGVAVLKQGAVFSDENPRTSAGEISKAMRSFGINSNPGDIRIASLADAGVRIATVQAACEEAKRKKPQEAIPVGYVVSILEGWAREAREMDVAGADRKARGKSSGREDGRKAAAKAVFGDAPSSRRIKDVN